jgi:hypothetical protein
MNRWCVPFAYAKPLGCTTDEVAELIQHHRDEDDGDQHTTGRNARSFWPREVARVYGFEQMQFEDAVGIKTLAYVRKPGMTLKTWAKLKARQGDTGAWLIHIAGHALLFKAGLFYDNTHARGATPETYSYAGSRLVKAQLVNVWDERNPYDLTKPETRATMG